MLKVKTICK